MLRKTPQRNRLNFIASRITEMIGIPLRRRASYQPQATREEGVADGRAFRMSKPQSCQTLPSPGRKSNIVSRKQGSGGFFHQKDATRSALKSSNSTCQDGISSPS